MTRKSLKNTLNCVISTQTARKLHIPEYQHSGKLGQPGNVSHRMGYGRCAEQKFV
jgi:hypothetical protein